MAKANKKVKRKGVRLTPEQRPRPIPCSTRHRNKKTDYNRREEKMKCKDW